MSWILQILILNPKMLWVHQMDGRLDIPRLLRQPDSVKPYASYNLTHLEVECSADSKVGMVLSCLDMAESTGPQTLTLKCESAMLFSVHRGVGLVKLGSS